MNKINQFLKGFYKGMKEFGHSVTVIINSALLFIVYIIGAGLTSVIAKLSGKHFLDIKLSKERESYWSELNLKKKPIDDYYRQF